MTGLVGAAEADDDVLELATIDVEETLVLVVDSDAVTLPLVKEVDDKELRDVEADEELELTVLEIDTDEMLLLLPETEDDFELKLVETDDDLDIELELIVVEETAEEEDELEDPGIESAPGTYFVRS